MKLRVVDFEVLTKEYKNYQDGMKAIEVLKDKIMSETESDRKECEDIIKRNQSGLIIDENSAKKDQIRFQQLQEKLMSLDQKYTSEIREMKKSLDINTFDELSEIIKKWSIDNDVDMVMGKMEVVYLKDQFDVTSEIIKVLTELGLVCN